MRRVAILALSAALVAPSTAFAYCRENTCDSDGLPCSSDDTPDCGMVLNWDRTCVGFATQEDGSATIPAATARTILNQAFATWKAADCGTGAPGVEVIDMGFAACSAAEYNEKAGNANLLIFRDQEWPHPAGGDNVALTTVTFDKNTGTIYDADIEVNTALYHITTDPANPDYDLLAVLTHEAGHFFGLAHTTDPNATMSPSITTGDLSHRILDTDDVAGICSLFPPAVVNAGCNPIPRHGYSSVCGADQQSLQCAMPRSPVESSGELPFAVALTLLLGIRRTTRGRGKQRPV